MRIGFFDSDCDILSAQNKGKLFERFTKRLVELCGYRDVVLRTKRASLEYDIEGVSKLHGRRLEGEAKAHDAAIGGKEVTAFVGKLVPLGLETGGIDGLFISTSALSPDGEDYLRTLTPDVQKAMKIGFRSLAGDQVTQFLYDNGNCVAETHVRRSIERGFTLHPHDTWLIIGKHGDILVTSCGPSPASAPTSFAAFDLGGESVDLSAEDVRRLGAQVPDLQDLTFLTTRTTIARATASEPTVLPTVLSGVGWFDYKFPSPPECFIGRERSVNEITRSLIDVGRGTTATRAIQVLSRSGVGKSSLLLKIASSDGATVSTVTVDGRNLLTPSNLRLVIAELASKISGKTARPLRVPERQEDIPDVLRALGEDLSGTGVAAIQIDQSEALLSRPAVFQALLDLVIVTTERSLPIVWIMARKNDLAATYDEGAAVELTRLNELSVPIKLDDFTTSEEQLLIDRLSDELGSKLSKQLMEAVLTFSSGFPWLLKRVCAHLIAMHRAGLSQSELVRGGLRAEDLFDEDLAGLDESDKALLRLFAANLPNPASELARRLEGEVSLHRLTEKLNEFLGRKLLRLSGDVYDTYNDVFKSYLLTDRVPFHIRYVFRVTPGPALALLPRIAEEGAQDTAAFARRIGGSNTATYNKLRELRLLGFIDPQPGRVALSTEASNAIDTDQLGEFLRRGLRGNALVSTVLDLLSRERQVQIDVVTELLMRELPHIEASATTWSQYSNILVNWLRYAGMVDVEGDQIRQRDQASDEMVLRRHFTLGNFSSGTFVPSVRPGRIKDLVEMLRTGSVTKVDIKSEFGTKHVAAVVRDAVSLNLAQEFKDRVELTPQGRALIGEKRALTERDIAVLALSRPNIRALLEAANTKSLDAREQREILQRFGSANWSQQTWQWRVGILTAWVVASGQALAGRRGLRVSDTTN